MKYDGLEILTPAYAKAVLREIEEQELIMAERKRGAPPKAGMPVKQLIVDLFAADKDKEWSVEKVIAALDERHGKGALNDKSIRWILTKLKKERSIHRVRNEGHFYILRFGPDPKPSLLPKQTRYSDPKAAPVDIASDLALLEEASAIIVKLQALVHRNQEVLVTIARLKSVL